MSDRVDMGLHFDQVAFCLEVLDQCLTAFKTVHACIPACKVIHRTVFIHDIDPLQLVAFAKYEVVRVVCRRHFHHTGTEFGYFT